MHILGCGSAHLHFWRCYTVETHFDLLLQAGYNLDCLMLRYQGVEWQDRSKWRCGAMVAPHQEGTYDGTSLNPLEVHLFSACKWALCICSVGMWYSMWQSIIS
jgi:hypothetical protein